MQLVKCWDINDKRPKEECYKAPNGKYYTTKEAYDYMVANHEWQDKCVDLYRDWVGRKDAGPSIWVKKLKEVKEYGNEVIYAAMLLSDDNARYAVANKNFNNEYQMAAYLWAIVNGNMLEADRKIREKNKREKEAKIQEQSHHYEEIQEQTKHRSKTVDISKFL